VEKGNFRPLEVPELPNRFRRHIAYIIASRAWPHLQIHVALWQHGWSRRTRDLLLVLTSQATVNGFWQSVRCNNLFVLPRKEWDVALHVTWKPTTFGKWLGSFKRTTKNVTTCITVKTTASITNKYWTLILAVQIRVWQIQYSGQQKCW